ncbi:MULTISPECIES: hypothetical protein [Winogradskyella]|uniref:hypothetical protein n=1 Tax=Winogradskyella TaxID=286104 RepID=UPI0015C6A21D|nr:MULTISPECIES: hypothetical protein [Winogradskyella]QXP80407.1 hypothetical protein H0I32_07230 [Winogradskyella sp. HaHa_3_26]
MDLARHCRLCDHKITSLKIGTTCSLNNLKPEFNKTCSKIELNKKFEDQLEYVNIDYQNYKRKKLLTYTYFVVFAVMGIAVIIGGFLFGKFTLESRIISSVTITIIVIGITLLGKAFGTLNTYRQDIEIAKSKKDNIDEVLKEYNITYDIQVMFGKEIHGAQDVHTELKIKGIR